MMTWGPKLVARRPDITMEMVDRFLTNMNRNSADFVFTVTRDARAEGGIKHVPLENP